MLGPFVQAGLQAVHDAALAQRPGGPRRDCRRTPASKWSKSQLAAHPMLMIGVALHLYPAYYQHPRVLEGLGEPPRAPFPEGYDLGGDRPAAARETAGPPPHVGPTRRTVTLAAATSAELLDRRVDISDVHSPIAVYVEERVVPLEVCDEDPEHVAIRYPPVVVHVGASLLD